MADPTEHDTASSPTGPADHELGWLERRFYRSASIHRVDQPAEGYRVVTLRGGGLRDMAWAPGQKIQIAVGGGSSRTYTPFRWDPTEGETSILAYLHSDGPGSLWATRARVGQACLVFGPRPSLDLGGLGDRPWLFGDETSMGLAVALGAAVKPPRSVVCVLEVSSISAGRDAGRAVGLSDPWFVQRREGDAHLEEVEVQMLRTLDSDPPSGFVLSGKATSIQRIRRLLRSRGVPTSRMRVKAYWAPGKAGLD
jgi:ferric-chelate reductase (NADPH)